MSVWDIIPTCNDEMSIYTLCAFTIIVAAWLLFTTAYTRYNSNEFRRIENWSRDKFNDLEAKCVGHDDYIADTTMVINKIHIDLAVQESSMKDLKSDISEIKKYISEINADIKTLLQREPT